MNEVEERAKEANNQDLWNKIWAEKGEEEWRKFALNRVYTRIERLLPHGSTIVDLGGGTGELALRLTETRGAKATVVDHSSVACDKAKEKGLEAICCDIDSINEQYFDIFTTFVATEVVEHLSEQSRNSLFQRLSSGQCYSKAIFSVPNNRLGPDEEPQHTVKYTAISFKKHLEHYWKHVRVEVLGPYLLGICGFPKSFTLSVTLPVRDEEDDLEATLASFRGVADQMVVGVDPRSKDKTYEIALNYADEVFYLDEPRGPESEQAVENGVHFSHIRNQCMDRCTGDWIFMTEGHERLVTGEDILLRLNEIPKHAEVAFVWRSGYTNGHCQRWVFPWLVRNKPTIRYSRMTHNEVDYPAGTYCIKLLQVRTLHERSKDKELIRHEQRKVQNRVSLMEDWIKNESQASLHYLGAEWRGYNDDKAIERLEELMRLPKKNGPMRYHTRLILARLYIKKGLIDEARSHFLAATEDDWSRIDHFVGAGDIAFHYERFDEALQFYQYAATRLGDPPFTVWWIDDELYSYGICQRLAMTLCELGRLEEALPWAKKVLELLPVEAHPDVFDETREAIKKIEETINGKQAA